MNIRRIPVLAALALTLAALPQPARAVLIGPGLGTQNTTQPANLPGWQNVGQIGIGTGTYIGSHNGDNWIITAQHLDPVTNHTIVFYPSDTFPTGGVSVGLDPTSAVRLKNPDNTDTDLVVIRTLTDPTLVDPALVPLQISTATPASSTAVTMAGIGADRGTTTNYFDGTTNHPGFNILSSRSKRWGTNVTSPYFGGGLTQLTNATGNNSFTTTFASDFSSPSNNPTSSESIGVSGDSGGAVFSTNSPNTLLGIMLYQEIFPGQPDNEALYGNLTDAANLATYYPQIFAATGVPEPSTALLLLAASDSSAFDAAGNPGFTAWLSKGSP